jgi:hypothetical protein
MSTPHLNAIVRGRRASRALPLSLTLGLTVAGCHNDHDNSSAPASDGPTASDNLPTSTLGDATAGQAVFRFETFGNERFWTDAVKLQQGFVAAGVTPLMALKLGLSVDSDALDAATLAALGAELKTNLSPANAPLLNSPATTVKLINAISGRQSGHTVGNARFAAESDPQHRR